jgi:hypothetical protein
VLPFGYLNRTVTAAPDTATPFERIVTLEVSLVDVSSFVCVRLRLLTDMLDDVAGATTDVVADAELLAALLSPLRVLVAVNVCVPVAVDVVVAHEKLTLLVCPDATVTADVWLNPLGVPCNATEIDALAEPLFFTATVMVAVAPCVTDDGIETETTCASIVAGGGGVVSPPIDETLINGSLNASLSPDHPVLLPPAMSAARMSAGVAPGLTTL